MVGIGQGTVVLVLLYSSQHWLGGTEMKPQKILVNTVDTSAEIRTANLENINHTHYRLADFDISKTLPRIYKYYECQMYKGVKDI